MSFSGMDVEEVEHLTNRLDLQARAIDTVVSVVDAAILGLADIWAGEDLAAFGALWHRTHRPKVQSVGDQLRTWVTQLRQQTRQQEAASSGWTPRNSFSSAASMLSFAKAAEEWRHVTTSLPAGWHQLSAQELEALGIDHGSLHKPGGTGLDASVFSDGDGHYVISYAGTAGTWYEQDWVDNGRGVASGLVANTSGQTEQAATLAQALVARVGVDHVMLTGHSLGGRVAAVASMASGAHAVTFNAAAVTDEDVLFGRVASGDHVSFGEYLEEKLMNGATLETTGDEARVTNYVISNDIVTAGQEVLLGRSAFGQTVVVPTDTASMFDAHGLENFDGRI